MYYKTIFFTNLLRNYHQQAFLLSCISHYCVCVLGKNFAIVGFLHLFLSNFYGTSEFLIPESVFLIYKIKLSRQIEEVS